MEINSLGKLTRSLTGQINESRNAEDDGSQTCVDNCAKLLEDFNKLNEMRFRFEDDSGLLKNISDQEKDVFYSILNTNWSFLSNRESIQTKEKIQNRVRLIAACLNSIRIVSRDSETIKFFENSKLLEIIQVIANLTCQEDKSM